MLSSHEARGHPSPRVNSPSGQGGRGGWGICLASKKSSLREGRVTCSFRGWTPLKWAATATMSRAEKADMKCGFPKKKNPNKKKTLSLLPSANLVTWFWVEETGVPRFWWISGSAPSGPHCINQPPPLSGLQVMNSSASTVYHLIVLNLHVTLLTKALWIVSFRLLSRHFACLLWFYLKPFTNPILTGV